MNSIDIDTDYNQLIGLVYEGALEARPWQSALPALREAMDAQVVSLVLRPPTANDQGVILNCIRPETGGDDNSSRLANSNDWAWENETSILFQIQNNLTANTTASGETAFIQKKSVPIQISVATIPVPAAIWLFGSALVGLAILKRK